MKKIVVKHILVSLSFLFVFSNAQSQTVKVYPHHVEPKEYPDYSRRPFKTPNWETFNNKVQFIGGRRWGKTFGKLDETPPVWMPGAKVMQPNINHFIMDSIALKRSLLELKKKEIFLFNIGGFGPGTPFYRGFGQTKVEPWKSKMMKNILEDHYMGYDLGEQDGRYWFIAKAIDFPLNNNYQERYLKAMDFMQQAAKDQGDVISLLSVKWFWHYPIKDGFITISGSESQNKLYTSNDQVQYAFLRGASKQHGLLWFGNISVFNSWGYKNYARKATEKSSPLKGNSLSWMRRMLLSHYQYNAAILGFEGGHFNADHSLSPIGKLQTEVQQFVNKRPKAGPQHTAVALVQDFFSGWMPPMAHLPEKFTVWNFLPFKKGDYFSHHVLNMFYNDYAQTGLHKNEHGGLTNTPYGDALDVLLSDTRLSALKRYQVVVLGSDIKTNVLETGDKLRAYVKNGGHVVLTKNNFEKLFPNLNDFYANDLSKILNIKEGKGKITLLNVDNMGVDGNMELDNDVKNTLHKIFKSTRLFSLDNDLGYITNIEGNGKYLLGIYNNDLKSKPFKITSHIGKIKNIKEVKVTKDLTKELGYFPEGFDTLSPGLSDASNIAGGDVRIFLIDVTENNIEQIEKIAIEKRVHNRFLSMSSLFKLKQKLQVMPTFFDYFSGVKIHWKQLLEIDEAQFESDNWWYRLKQLEIAIQLDDEFFKASKKTLTEVQKITSKMEYLKLITVDKKPSKKAIKLIGTIFKVANSDIKTTSEIAYNYTTEINKPIIINTHDNNWDAIYTGIKENVAQEETISSNQQTIKLKNKVAAANANFYFSHHKNDIDLSKLLSENPKYLEHFGGVKIDGTYLFSRSIDKCKEEAKDLNKTGVQLIVDLCREINNYPDLTWLSDIDHAYKRSVAFHDNVLGKMKIMGVNRIIIGSHMRPNRFMFDYTPEENITKNMAIFIDKANKLGIKVSIQNRMYRHYPKRVLASPKEVSKLVANFKQEGKDISYALHLGFDNKPQQLINGMKNQVDLCIIASEGNPKYDFRIPYGRSKLNTKKIILDKNVIKIFDAEYTAIDELIEEKKYVK